MNTSSNTADRIMNSALIMVQQRGFTGFSFRDIAAEVGIKTASIHYHFPTKPDLAKAVLQHVRAEFGQELRRINNIDDGPISKLKAFARIFLDTYAEGDRLCPFCMVACAQDGVPDFVVQEVREFWGEGEQWVSSVIQSGQTTGAFSARHDPLISASGFVATLEGSMVMSRAFDDRDRLVNAADWYIQQLTAD